MQESRTAAIALVIVLTLGLCFLSSFSFFLGGTPNTFFWGVTIGAIFGIATWFYLADAWDPVNLRPTDPDTPKADLRILWTVPASVALARILSLYVREEISALIIGVAMTWSMFTLLYMAIQAWRHRPK